MKTSSQFWNKVDKTGDCWLWLGCKDKLSYGRVHWPTESGLMRLAHRVSFLLVKGYLPELDLDHLCRNPSCVNPEHLEPVTHKVNVIRGKSPSAVFAKRDLCSRGHKWDSFRVRKGGYIHRACKKCENIYRRERQLIKGQPEQKGIGI